MQLESRILPLLCAFLFGCEREGVASDGDPERGSPAGVLDSPVAEATVSDPRSRRPTAEERAAMDAKIEIAKSNPQALLDIIHHGDPTGWISQRQAISLLHLHCDDWKILASVIRDLEGAAQVDMASQVASGFSYKGDFESAHQLINAMNPGVARATAMRMVLRDHVSSSGPDELLGRLNDCEPDEIEIVVEGFSSGALLFFKQNPAAGRPDLTQYEVIKGLPEEIAESYVLGNATSRPYESLDFLKDLEQSKMNHHVLSWLDSWAQSTKSTFDKNLVDKVLSIKGATDLWAVRKKLEEFGFNP